MDDKILLSIHVCEIPCPEEIMLANVSAGYKAYIVEVPSENVPTEVKEIIEGKHSDRRITSAVLFKKG